jgi:SAM-dependent methyltransferase
MKTAAIYSVLPSGIKTLARIVLGRRVSNLGRIAALVKDRTGLEIGGPSGTFQDSGILPIYRYAAQIDNCVFAEQTYWEDARCEGRSYFYHPRKPKGLNFILESTDLRGIEDSCYGFLLASHTLEHTANPVKALKEWKRVVRPGGLVVIVLPHHRHNFDRKRQPTPVNHMMDDYAQNRDESDLSHIKEVLELQEFTPTDKVPSREHFLAILENNKQVRLMHHHVFDERNSEALLKAVGFGVFSVQFIKPHHIVLLCTA